MVFGSRMRRLGKARRWFGADVGSHIWSTNGENGSKFPNAILKDLATEFQILRYDASGTGMSDWEADEISLEAWVQDLDTVSTPPVLPFSVARGIPKRGSGHRLHGAKS